MLYYATELFLSFIISTTNSDNGFPHGPQSTGPEPAARFRHHLPGRQPDPCRQGPAPDPARHQPFPGPVAGSLQRSAVYPPGQPDGAYAAGPEVSGVHAPGAESDPECGEPVSRLRPGHSA